MRPQQRKVILGVAASDSHAVANHLIAHSLRGLGYTVVNLGTCTPVEEFAEAAEGRFKALDYDVRVKVGDGSRGWPEHEPFDRIIVTAAAPEPPQELLDELAPGGRMVIPLGGSDVQVLSVVEKDAGGAIVVRAVMPVRFTQLELIS